MKLFNLNEKKKTSLRKKMIFYFLLIAIANVFVAGEFVWEIKSKGYRDAVVSEVNQIKEGKAAPEHIYVILDNLAQKFVIMIFILIIVSAVVLFLFVIQIASPIQYMINQAKKMSEGDLSIRVEIKSKDEMAVLGKVINDLSINLQEVVAQLERMVFNLERAVILHRSNLKQFPNIRSYFDEESEMLETILKEFRLLKDAYILFTIDSLMKNVSDE
ncbi:MAG: HAMP domain-containing protein [bacterium]|nr:HAMP domain-containing protein [bacterium]